MDIHPIRILITIFFENDFPKEYILKFQQWFLRKANSEVKDNVLTEIWEREMAETNEQTVQALEEINRRIGRNKNTVIFSLSRSLLRIASVLLLLVIGGLLTYWIIHDRAETPAHENVIVEHIVPDGEMKQIYLPDGSEVWLNSGSILLYSNDFSGPVRRLFLNGEAMFCVEKDVERPFIVKSQYFQVEALGTTFNVRSYIDAGTATVTLEEGALRVDIDARVRVSEVLLPNEQIVYNHRKGKTTKQQVDGQLVSKWKDGYLVFENASFEEIIRTVERRFNVTVYYDIRKYGGGKFSVKYKPYENVQQVLDILETLNPGLKWTINEDTIYIE